ncbi:hypothetical protein BS78_10G144900 [Paspalum vaginatum]|nr:hypothetical protein BS78_10G144900 [Paspalum vaginatum]
MRLGSPWASSVAGSTVSSREEGLRLIDCPHCSDGIIKIRSKKDGTYGDVYYKCPNNIWVDPTSCPFIRSEKQYASFLHNLEARDEGPVRFGFVDHGIMEEAGNGALKKQVQELKEVVEMQSRDIWSLKM